MQTEITLTRDGRLLNRYQLQPGDYLIGRDPSCAILVEDEDVSRRHARLTVGDHDLRLEDLGSANGTFVGDTRVQAATSLSLPQQVRLGTTVLELRGLDDADLTLASAPAAESVPESAAAAAGVARYTIGDEVARGGMGAILRARDLTLKRTVAMKVATDDSASSASFLQRFTQEAEVTGQLEHPNIVPVHELGTDEQGRTFYTMKFVQGVTLHDVLEDIKRGETGTLARYPLVQLLTIFQKVCDAVAFAHSKGVVHRDLKPANIMIGDYGEVLVMDWGLAKVVGRPESEVRDQNPAVALPVGLTLAGQVMGTPQFMAPEQAAGNVDEIDARSDIFALGAILYNILTLHPVVSGETVEEVLQKIRRGQILPPTSFNQKTGKKGGVAPKASGQASMPRPPLFPLRHIPGGRVPESLSAVCMKALALKKEDRYQTVPELQKDIAAYQGGFATAAERAGAVKLLWLLVKRHKVEAIAAVVIVALVAGFMVKVIASERKATATLAELRGTAPQFYEKAQALLQQQQLEAALQAISYAISLQPQQAAYHHLQGNLLVALLRIKEAKEAYALAVRNDATDSLAAQNLSLCEKILQANPGREKPGMESVYELYTALLQQERFAEAQALQRTAGITGDRLFDIWKARLERAGLWAVLEKNGRLPVPGGPNRYGLNLSGLPISDLSPLGGIPILASLIVSDTKVSDLSPLQGMPLENLEVGHTEVSDLRPLRGMKLTSLHFNNTKVNDLSPLKGMPLRALNIAATSVSDLSLLRGMPLTALDISHLKVRDLAPLKGMALEHLYATTCGVSDLRPLRGMPLKELVLDGDAITDLSPLQGMPLEMLSLATMRGFSDLSFLKNSPLRWLNIGDSSVRDISALRGLSHLRALVLDGCHDLRDLTPLADCQELEVLSIPAECTDIEFLRRLPKLKRLTNKGGFGFGPTEDQVTPVAEFWKEYDAEKHQGQAPRVRSQ